MWTCPNCGEVVDEDEFKICWNCSADRDGVLMGRAMKIIGKMNAALFAVVVSAGMASMAGCSMGDKDPVVSYWTTDVAPPAGVQVSGHPCGKVIIIESDHIPAAADWLQTNLVHDIDAQGRIIRTWRVPIDHLPVGVDGDDLLLYYGPDPPQILRVSLDGSMSLVRQAPKFLKGKWCNKPYPDVGDEICVPYQEEPYRELVSSVPCT